MYLLCEKYEKDNYPLRRFAVNEVEYVYVVYNRFTKLFKIGMTTNLRERVGTLSTQNGTKLNLILAIRLCAEIDDPSILVEQYLHTYFKSKRVLGEWFKLNIKDIIEIRNLFWNVIQGDDVKDNCEELKGIL